jgi:hypothetical protein
MFVKCNETEFYQKALMSLKKTIYILKNLIINHNLDLPFFRKKLQ